MKITEESFDNVDVLIESVDDCLDHGRFLFNNVSKHLLDIAQLGVIVANVNLEEFPFTTEICLSMKYLVEELSEHMQYHCDDLKECGEKYGELTDHAMTLLRFLVESLDTPGEPVSTEFEEAYHKMTPTRVGKKLIDLLKNDDQNPLKLAAEGEDLYAAYEVHRWEGIISSILSQLMFIEAYVGGDASELKRDVEEFLGDDEDDEKREEEKEKEEEQRRQEEEERRRQEEEERRRQEEEERQRREEEEAERRRQEEEERRRKEEEEAERRRQEEEEAERRRKEEEERRRQEEEERRRQEEEAERRRKEEEERRRQEEEERRRREEEEAERRRQEEEERRRKEEEEAEKRRQEEEEAERRRKEEEEAERRRREEEERRKPFPVDTLLKVIQDIQDNNIRKTCDEKALLIQRAIEARDTKNDLFYIIVMPTSDGYVYHPTLPDQLLISANRGNCTVIVYQSREARHASHEDLKKMERQVESYKKLIRLLTLRLSITQNQVDKWAREEIDNNGFVIAVKASPAVAVRSTRTDILQWGPGWWMHDTLILGLLLQQKHIILAGFK